MFVGSPGYASPERLDLISGPEGDVYGLGVLLLALSVEGFAFLLLLLFGQRIGTFLFFLDFMFFER